VNIAFSYLRFSTPEQQRGDSFRRQKELAERYAREHGLRLDPRSFADLGVSAFRGANAETGMLGAFLEAVKLGTVPAGSSLLVESLDRLSRNIPRKALRVLEDICEAGITLVTLADNKVYDLETIDRDPMAMMMAYVVAMRANEESERKSHRIRSAWSEKRANASRKKPMTKLAPGWLKLREDRRAYEVVPERVEVVKRIFRQYLEGKGTHGIADGLNKDGVKPFGRAAFWHRSYVVKILENPAVVGRFTPHTIEYVEGKRTRKPQEPVEDYFPKVVEPEVFARVQSMREGRRAPSVRLNSTRGVSHLLAGLARCPRCRSAMSRTNKGSSTKSGHPYLVCSRAKAGAGCEYHGVRIDHLEAAIVEHASELSKSAPKGSKTVEDVKARLAEEREKLQGQIEKLVDFLSEGEAEGVRQRLRALEARLAEVREEEERVEELEAVRNPITRTQRLEDLVGELSKSDLDYPAANAAMLQVFSRVYVQWDLGRLDFHWLHGGISRLPIKGPQVLR
tara:strand:- start:8630 stop:10156 length:1527 start_codon:yes stop_codon:yes gene_type:complete